MMNHRFTVEPVYLGDDEKPTGVKIVLEMLTPCGWQAVNMMCIPKMDMLYLAGKLLNSLDEQISEELTEGAPATVVH